MVVKTGRLPLTVPRHVRYGWNMTGTISFRDHLAKAAGRNFVFGITFVVMYTLFSGLIGVYAIIQK